MQSEGVRGEESGVEGQSPGEWEGHPCAQAHQLRNTEPKQSENRALAGEASVGIQSLRKVRRART